MDDIILNKNEARKAAAALISELDAR